jgi:inositol phosphorylceramide synthase catalytic subunit
MTRLWAHMRALWPRHTLLPALPLVIWSLISILRGERRWELMSLVVLGPALAYTNKTTKKLLIGVYPLALVGLLYYVMNFGRNIGLTPSRIHTCDLRALDVRLFGVMADGHKVALGEWLQRYSSTTLDILCAIPYGTFIFAMVAYAVYLYRVDFTLLQRFAWSFFWVNVAGFLTYHVYPAAPPWYVHTHGCSADLLAGASEGAALARVDHLLHSSYFAGIYGRASDVFGAVPSLHAGYPVLILMNGWRRTGWLGHTLAFLFFFAMCFSALYLDHHWMVDIVLGASYAALASTLVRWYFARRTVTRSVPAFAEAGGEDSNPSSPSATAT